MTIRRVLQDVVLRAEAGFDRPFGAAWNPLRQLGTLAFFYYWICAASGIYLYILFDTSVTGVYDSIEYLTVEQWYLGGVMRSLHRYSSDAMVVLAVLHLTREFLFDRYRGVRWFAWFTGVSVLWFLYMSGISGYWLVWDQLAQYVATGSMEWMDWLGIFGEPVANNFLTQGSLGDRFFSLLIFIHIFVPLFLLFIMWVHVMRIAQPRINPPRGLAAGSTVALLALALAKPAVSHPPADLSTVPSSLNLDWFYMLLYPLFDAWGPGPLWLLAVGGSVAICILPWLPTLRREAPAEVFLEKCNGCTRCFNDCPYSAITMHPRSDGRPFEEEAVVDPDLCVNCGICVGSCPVSTPFRHSDELVTGIDLPNYPLGRVRDVTQAAMDRLTQAPGGRVLVFGCEHGPTVEALERDGIATVPLPCAGMLPPSFVDWAISRGGVDGVVVAGCRERDCYHRLGVRWTQDRMAGLRDPYLRARVPREQVMALWAARTDTEALIGQVEDFRRDLASAALDDPRPAMASAIP